jgi:hypothetical protein
MNEGMEQGQPAFCLSCGMPLGAPDAKDMSEQYCGHCTDDDGRVKSRDEIKKGIAMWIMSWQHVDEPTAMDRAEHYMKSMPEWAEK